MNITLIKTVGSTQIQLVQASVVTYEATAIVNAANSSLAGGSGVDGAIHKAAGKELHFYTRNLGKCKTGEAKISPSFNISTTDYIIHTVGPYYSGNSIEENERLLTNCYKNSLNLAKDFTSVAFPGISTGIYGYPLKDATKVALASIESWIKDNLDTKLETISLCAFTQDEYEKLYEVIASQN